MYAAYCVYIVLRWQRKEIQSFNACNGYYVSYVRPWPGSDIAQQLHWLDIPDGIQAGDDSSLVYEWLHTTVPVAGLPCPVAGADSRWHLH